MTQMERFHATLNRSQKRLTEATDSYRESIDVTIRSVLRGMSSKERIVVIGAGNCTDVSLPIFLDECRNIILTDIDGKAMDNCAKERPNIKKITVDYTGFEPIGFFESFAQNMWACQSTSDIDAFVQRTMTSVAQYTFLDELVGLVDLVYVSPIYTQLVYHQMAYEIQGLLVDKYPQELADRFLANMLEQMPDLITRFNDNLIRLLKPEGILFVLSDIFEMNHESAFYRKILLSIKQQDVMDEIYQDYQSKYGMGFGDYGLYDLSTRLELKKRRWLLWRFDEDRSFVVHLNIYQQPTKGGTI